MNLKEKMDKNKLYGVGISLVMAIFLWSWVIGVENPEIDMPFRGVDVEFEGEEYLKKEGYSIISPQSPKVNIVINGTKSDLNGIKNNNFKVSLDLQGLHPGENKVPVDYVLQGQTGNIRVVDVEPSTILVKIDKVVSENKQIEVETLGNLPESFTLGSVRALNNYVRVTGATSNLSQISRVVAYADISEKTESFMVTSKIVFLDKNNIELNNIEANSETVDLEVPVYKIKSVPILVKTYGSLGQNQSVENIKIVPENIIVRGNKEAIDKISQVETEPINVSSLITNKNYIPKLKLSDGISLHEDVKLKLVYDYSNKIERIFTKNVGELVLENTNNSFNYNLLNTPENFNITVFGEEDMVNKLKAEGLTLSVDLSGLGIGEHIIEVSLSGLDEVDSVKVEPAGVSVNIVEKPTSIEENSNIENTNGEGNN